MEGGNKRLFALPARRFHDLAFETAIVHDPPRFRNEPVSEQSAVKIRLAAGHNVSHSVEKHDATVNRPSRLDLLKGPDIAFRRAA